MANPQSLAGAPNRRADEAHGAVGGKDESLFLDEQMKAPKDKFVEKACRDAIAAIDMRLAPSAPK